MGSEQFVEKYGERELQRRRLKGSNSRRFTEIAKLPKKSLMCAKLAEFIGIHLGDGTMDEGFVRITGDVRYDLPFLSNYVLPLVNDLFGVQARLYTSGKNRLNLIASSTALCRYLNRRWGIPYGDKIRNSAHIPLCILKNRALFFACLRGLIDTDGSVSKDNDTISIRFDSHNPALMNSLIDGLSMHAPDLFTFSYSEGVGTHSTEKVKKYFGTVGSSNLKHVVRFSEWYLHDNLVYVRDVSGYFKFYENINLPFILDENLRMDGPVV